MESNLPMPKLAGIQQAPARTASPPGILLPDWFSPPPGLAAPPGLAPPGNFSLSAQKGGAGADDSTESDTEVTSVGTASFEGAASSERDNTEPDEVFEETETSPLKAGAPVFVPSQPQGPESDSPKQTPLRTPLRKTAGLFVPGQAPALPFVPMAKVEEAWKRWESKQYSHGEGKESSSKRGSRQRNGKSWH